MRRHILSSRRGGPLAECNGSPPYASIRCEYATGGGADRGRDSASPRRGVARLLHLADTGRGVPDGRTSVPWGTLVFGCFLLAAAWLETRHSGSSEKILS